MLPELRVKVPLMNDSPLVSSAPSRARWSSTAITSTSPPVNFTAPTKFGCCASVNVPPLKLIAASGSAR